MGARVPYAPGTYVHGGESNWGKELKFLFALSVNFPFTLSSSFLFFRKDQDFMRLLNNVKLEDLINKTASTVQRELSQVTPDCTGNELFTIKEDVSPKINVLLCSSPWARKKSVPECKFARVPLSP